MHRSNKGARILLVAMLLLSSSALTACSLTSPKVTVMPEAKTVQLKAGQAAPFDGWLLTSSAAAKLFECCEKAEGK